MKGAWIKKGTHLDFIGNHRSFLTKTQALAALSGRDRLGVIGEIKRRSPSKGDLNAGLDPERSVIDFTRGFVERFAQDVAGRLGRLGWLGLVGLAAGLGLGLASRWSLLHQLPDRYRFHRHDQSGWC